MNQSKKMQNRINIQTSAHTDKQTGRQIFHRTHVPRTGPTKVIDLYKKFYKILITYRTSKDKT